MKNFNGVIRIFYLLTIAIIIAGCSSNSDFDDFSFEIMDNNDLVVSAKVANASQYNRTIEVKAYIYDTNAYMSVELSKVNWKHNGFSIVLPNTLDTKYLHPLIYGEWWNIVAAKTIFSAPSNYIIIQPSITISNENVKIVDAQFFGEDKDGFFSGIFCLDDTNGNWLTNDNSTKAVFTYVDSDVTISGNVFSKDITSDGFVYERTETYSINWKKGWNVWYRSKYDETKGNTSIFKEKWSSAPSIGLKWNGNNSVLL